VCLSVCKHISYTTYAIFTIYCARCPSPWLGPSPAGDKIPREKCNFLHNAGKVWYLRLVCFQSLEFHALVQPLCLVFQTHLFSIPRVPCTCSATLPRIPDTSCPSTHAVTKHLVLLSLRCQRLFWQVLVTHGVSVDRSSSQMRTTDWTFSHCWTGTLARSKLIIHDVSLSLIDFSVFNVITCYSVVAT